MNEFVDFYQQQAKSRLATKPWLAQMQKDAIHALSEQGFPTRHHEEWKYTPVDNLVKQAFTPANEAIPGSIPSGFDLPFALQIPVYNGVIGDRKACTALLPEGVLVLTLAEAIEQQPELLQGHLGQVLHQEHGFHALNMAMLHGGLLIYIPEGVHLLEPIALVHYQDKANQAVYLRHLIIAEAHSDATIVEHYQGSTECSYLTNTVTEITLGAQAKLTHYKIQQESRAAFHLGHLAVSQAMRSQFASHSLSLGGKLVRSDISMYLREAHAHCLMNGIYAPAEGQHVDHHTTVHHKVPDCSSDQDYKGILSGQSRAVFNGKVIVSKDAQHTNAKQQNKNLLLSANAEVNTKPQLEIYADDVLCSHGATVGQLDEEALFYLATRGISRQEASQYLIHAFANDNLRLIPHPKLAEWMGNLITEQVG